MLQHKFSLIKILRSHMSYFDWLSAGLSQALSCIERRIPTWGELQNEANDSKECKFRTVFSHVTSRIFLHNFDHMLIESQYTIMWVGIVIHTTFMAKSLFCTHVGSSLWKRFSCWASGSRAPSWQDWWRESKIWDAPTTAWRRAWAVCQQACSLCIEQERIRTGD